MGYDKEILIKRNIEKSDEALEYAELAINGNGLTTALNRIYYALFYSISALALKHEFVTVKHTKLMGWFNKKFVYEDKKLDKKFTKIYSDAFMQRQESDYLTMYTPNIEQVKKLYLDVLLMIKLIRNEIWGENANI